MKPIRIPLSSLYTDSACMVRAALNTEAVTEYCEAYGNGEDLPPLTVFKQSSGKYLIADGWHRYEAAKQAGLKTVPVRVHKGEHEKVVAAALEGNRSHGIRRTNADKRVCAEIAIETWPDESNRQVAQRAGVSESFIRELRTALEKTGVKIPETRTGSDGKDYPAKSSTCARNAPDDPKTPEKTHISTEPTPDQKNVEVLDSTGFPIPEKAMEYWNRKQEIQDILTQLSNLKGLLKAKQEEDDIMWREVNFSGAMADLSRLWTNIQTAKPYAVCPTCQGKLPEKCAHCRGRGLLSEFRWAAVAKEIKVIREKAVATGRARA